MTTMDMVFVQLETVVIYSILVKKKLFNMYEYNWTILQCYNEYYSTM